MSREIKFRCWSEKEKSYLDASKSYIDASGLYSPTDLQITLEQYTGLKDKNGKEIYEGDLVKVSGEVILNDDICVDPVAEIVWVDSAAGFGEKFTVKKAPMVPIGLYSYEVVGNIHEKDKLVDFDHVKGGEE